MYVYVVMLTVISGKVLTYYTFTLHVSNRSGYTSLVFMFAYVEALLVFSRKGTV